MKKELTKRILTTLIGIPLTLGTLYYGGVIMLVVTLILSTFCLFEYFNLFKHINVKVLKYSSYTINIVFISAFYIFSDQYGFQKASSIIFLMFPLVYLISAGLTLFNKDKHAINQFSGTLSYIFYITLPFISLMALRMVYASKLTFDYNFSQLLSNDFCGMFVIGVFVSIWSGDTAAYFIGKKFGKHKLIRSISPHKSVEGSIANIIFATSAIYIYKQFLFPDFNDTHIIIIGLIVGIFGQIGDLFESKLKRHALVKDSSNLLPGHGGFLDRLDSTLFVMPAVLTYVLLVFIN